MKVLFVAVTAIAALGTVSAQAASPASPAAAWTGFYLGLGVGERTSTIDTSVSAASFFSPPESLVGPLFCTAALPCIPGEPLDNAGFRISPYLGYNWQIAPSWIGGVEADWGWANAGRMLSGMVAPGGGFLLAPGTSDNSFSVTTKWDASVRARLGFAPSTNLPLLLYVTGGVAWLNEQQNSVCGAATTFNSACQVGSYGPSVFTDSTTRTGWTIGGGLESMLWGQWILRAEYRYADFGTWSPTDIRSLAGPPPAQFIVTDAIHVRTQTATFGVAYKFGGPADPPKYDPAPVHGANASWSGAYVGLGLGERTSNVNASVTSATFLPAIGLVPANLLSTCTAAAPCIPGEPLDSANLRFSPYIGYNWQFAPSWLTGVEADFGWARNSRTLSGMMAPGGNGFFFAGLGNGLATGSADNSYSVTTKWDASVRARLGYIPETPVPVLVYATGGFAWLNVQQSSVCGTSIPSDCYVSVFAATPTVITDSTTLAGWTAGGGLEVMPWDHWTLRGEYRYADFGTWTVTDSRLSPGVGSIFAVTDAIRFRTQTVTFGAGYKF